MSKEIFHRETKANLLKLLAGGVAIVVDDNGHSAHKLISIDNKGQLISRKVLTRVASNSEGLTDAVGRKVGSYYVAGVEYSCNENMSQDSNFALDSYQHSAENVALTANGIELLGHFDKRIVLATTLPFKRMNVDDNNDKVKKAFKSEIVKAYDSKHLKIIDHLIMREGELVFYDFAIEWDGTTNPELQGKTNNSILIIDIGGGTTDCVSITNSSGLKIASDGTRSGTIENFGILKVKGEVAKLLKQEILKKVDPSFSKMVNELAPRTIEEAFLTGVVNYPGIDGVVDISLQVNEIKGTFCDQLMRHLIDTVGRIDGFDTIIFAGGGAIGLKAQLNVKLPGCHYRDEYSNANGLFKVLAFQVVPKRKDAWLAQVAKTEAPV